MDTYYDFRIRAVNFNYATGNYQDSPDNTFFNFTTAAQPYIAPPRLLTVVGTTSFYNGGQYTSFADLK